MINDVDRKISIDIIFIFMTSILKIKQYSLKIYNN